MKRADGHPDPETLQEYADRSLSPEETALVTEHVARCGACRRTVEAVRSLQAELAALPREIRPDRDLRPAAPEGGRTRRRRAGPVRPVVSVGLRVAAAVLLLLGGTVAIVLLAGRPDGKPASRAEAPIAEAVSAAAPGTIESYERAGRALAAELEARRDELDPETARVLDHSLAAVDEAIRELEGARASFPSDRTLTELLEGRHRMRLELLRDAATRFTDT